MLVLAGFGIIAHDTGIQTAIVILALMALSGSAAGMMLPENPQFENKKSSGRCYPLQRCPSAAG